MLLRYVSVLSQGVHFFILGSVRDNDSKVQDDLPQKTGLQLDRAIVQAGWPQGQNGRATVSPDLLKLDRQFSVAYVTQLMSLAL